MSFSVMRRAAIVAGLALAVSGCTYDYLQRTDRVAYSAGDAVRANLERETINPSYAGQYSTKGLGKNGSVVPEAPVVVAN
jgi:hypothetical protein